MVENQERDAVTLYQEEERRVFSMMDTYFQLFKDSQKFEDVMETLQV
jgi:hypothetical protein